VRLLSNEPETPTTRRVRLDVDGIPFHYRAGQAAALAAGAAEPTPYSIASAPHETARHGWLEFLVKVDGTSRFGRVVATLQPGATIRVEGPAGNFVLPERLGDVPLVFIAGGTGIAPMRSMIFDALHKGHQGTRSLVYSARTPGEFAYLDQLNGLAEQGQLALTLTLTGEVEEWAHARGRARAEHFLDLVSPAAMAYVCGPTAMVADLPPALVALGLPRERIRTDDW
jgi:CDP-4-dehydro-6-deoxyglucose reductase, E3